MNIIDAIYKSHEAKRGYPHRPHLGGSQIGNSCERALWYQFRWAGHANFDGRMLRLFETGQLAEARFISDLRAIGITVWDTDADGRQFSYSRFGGHFALSLDGVCDGIEDHPGPHTLEFKTMNEKTFKALTTNGLQKTKPTYWAQVHVGMLLSEIPACLFMAVNKNTDELYAERVDLDAAFAQTMIDKAERIVFAESAPPRIADTEDWFECKFCDHNLVCHRDTVPEINCRTCAHATARTDGTWHCAVKDKVLDIFSQQLGCKQHLTHPEMVNLTVHDAGEDWIEYVTGDGEIVRNQGREWRGV